MGLKEREAARRLITLLDAAYEGGVAVFVLAEGGVEELFRVRLAKKAKSEKVRDEGFEGVRGHRAAVSTEPESPDPALRDTDAEGLRAEEEDEEDDIMLRETLGAYLAIQARDLAYRRRSPFSPGSTSLTEQQRERIEHMAIWTGEDEVFAFKRAGSRLREMGWSVGYWARAGENRGIDRVDAGIEGVDTGFGAGTVDRSSIEADFGDEASYHGYLKQFTKFNPSLASPSSTKPTMKPFADWHFFGMQNDEESWSVKAFFRQLRKRYEPPPADFKVKEGNK